VRIKFFKMSGAGNDFVLVGGGRFAAARLKKLAVRLCSRGTGVGADGLLWVQKKSPAHIAVRYFNRDGSEAFCGNGSRCAAWWAFRRGLVKRGSFMLSTAAGELPVRVTGDEKVKMRMPAVRPVSLRHKGRYPKKVGEAHFLDTGVPHAVIPVKDLRSVDVAGLGRLLRNNRAFGPAGANVDFVSLKRGVLNIRTYERGVEAETSACGTGVAAAAVAMGLLHGLPSPVPVGVWSGARFRVWFKPGPACSAAEIYLEGPARIVFEGVIEISGAVKSKA